MFTSKVLLTCFGELSQLMINHKKIKIGHWLCAGFIGYLSIVSFYLSKDIKTITLVWYSVVNFLIMLFTLQDKSAAKRDKQRISELRFYVLSLLGGWFGGYLVQQWCRHKTQKQPFRYIYWSCAWLHSIAAITSSYLYINNF